MSEPYSHDVFISFSFKDQAIVDRIVNQLTGKYRILCWIVKFILPDTISL